MVGLISEGFALFSYIPRVLGLFIILLVGFGFAKIFEIATNKIAKRSRIQKYVYYSVIIFTLIYGLFYFNQPTFNLFESEFIKNLNLIVEVLLILTIGLMLVNLTIYVLDWVMDTLKIKESIKHFGLGSEFIFTIELFLKVILYLVVFEVVVLILNLKSTLINTILLSIVVATVALFTSLFFYGLKDFFVNWFSGLAIRSNDIFKPGKKIRYGDISGEIISVNTSFILVDDGKGNYITIPNKELTTKEVFIQKSRFDLKILEELRTYFKDFSTLGGYLSIILEIFGISHKNKKLKRFEETDWKKIISFVKESTKSNVSGLIVPYKNVINLKQEVKSWLADGGLLILRIFKPAIFPGIKKKRETNVLCVGVEKDSLVLIDLKGGVYLMNYKDVEDAIERLDDKYYIVFAKKGSTAFFRIKNKLYYSNPDYYENLNKTAERKLKQIMRKLNDNNYIYPNNLPEVLNNLKV